MTMTNNISKHSTPVMWKIAKVILLTVLGLVLAIYATLVCLVSVLSPDKLTPLVGKAANELLDAKVDMSRVELSTISTYPFLKLEIDSLCVISPRMTEIKADTSVILPAYSDTLIVWDNFVGEIDMAAFMTGTVDINNVTVKGLGINIVIVNDSINNFDIIKQSDTAQDSVATDIPEIILRHFSIEDAKLFNFYDIPTETNSSLRVSTLVDRNKELPLYRMNFNGDFGGNILDCLNLNTLLLNLDGELKWDYNAPHEVELNNFKLNLDRFNAGFSLTADFGSELILKTFEAECHDLDIDYLISILPDNIVKRYDLGKLKTDAVLSLSARLDSAFNLDRDTIPHAELLAVLPQCRLKYGKARFERLAASVGLSLKGNDLSVAVLNINNFEVAGPATSLSAKGRVSDMIDNPNFDVSLDGFTNLSKLPPPLMKFIDGYLSGKVEMSFTASGRMSMFDKNNIHRLNVAGDIDFRKLYWLSSDTSDMVYVDNACLNFGSKNRYKGQDLLSAKIVVDTASILSGGTDISLSSMTLGVGVENRRFTGDTTLVLPLGGALKLGKLSINSITDSAGVRFRDIDGKVIMKRYNNQARVPEFVFDLSIDRFTAGSLDSRMLFSNSELHFDAHKLPVKKSVAEFKRLSDSISKACPHLSPDSVYSLAVEKRRLHRSRHHRVHSELTDSATEVIDWGTSKFLNKLLLYWDINGSLQSKRASLFTRHFPLRNRLKNLNLKFNNDSLIFSQIAYKVGHSDFLADGLITDLKRALTSRQKVYPLKINFQAQCDTIDVNQLADCFFKGAAYSQTQSSHRKIDFDIIDNDSLFIEFEKEDGLLADSMPTILIPTNIDANLKIRANNILYSDLKLHDMEGDMLLYDGAVNLHRLRTVSDVGSIDLSALYSAPKAEDARFGFGLQVENFKIAKFIDLVPAIDSLMPLLNDISGIINADIAATARINPGMDIDLPSLTAAVKLEGDSLCLLDADTFKTLAKWLMFKNKKRNIIDHMNVEMIISEGQMYMFPFVFDIDRYRIGVQGHNDLALNFNYLISVLKSPLPFKFGITIKGTPDDYHIRLGKAKFDEKQAIERPLIVNSARVNLIDQIEDVFRRGVRRSEFARLSLSADAKEASSIDLNEEPITAADSTLFIQEGLIPAPAETNND